MKQNLIFFADLIMLRFVVLLAFTELATVHAASVVAWGDNSFGQTNVPPGVTNAVGVELGGTHALAVTDDGRVVAWGDITWNSDGQTIVPPESTNVVAISAGQSHSLALRADGTVIAWGRNVEGQCNVPSGLAGVVAVSAGWRHSLALRANGTIVAWGTNNWGQLAVPRNLTNVTGIAAGSAHSLALRSDGTVVAWGDNVFGQCNVPADLTNAVAVSAGSGNSLALRADGTVVAWGWLIHGEPPAELTNAVAIYGWGYDDHAAITANRTVVTWGQGNWPVPPGLSGITAFAVSKATESYLALASPTNGVSISFISPLNQFVGSGSQAFFSVAAAGTPPLNYQWYYFNTNAVAGATNRWFSLSNAHPSQSGSYSVRVSNAQSTATSQEVTLSVIPSLDIVTAPAIKVNGEIGSTYRIDYLPQATTTGDWTPLTTVTLTNFNQYYFDLSAIGQPVRFYRLVSVP